MAGFALLVTECIPLDMSKQASRLEEADIEVSRPWTYF